MPEYRDDERLLSAMFLHDERGRLTGTAPLLHILRTADSVLVRCHAELPDAAAAALHAAANAPRGKPSAWAEEYASYVSLIAKIAQVTAIRAGPLYAFPEKVAEPSGCIAVDGTNSHLLRGTLDEWLDDVESGSLVVAALVDGRAGAVCASVRTSTAVHCAGVETAPQYRGRGLAALAVAGWAKLVRGSGAEPFYATTFDNIASQRVARKAGLNARGSEFSIYGSMGASLVSDP